VLLVFLSYQRGRRQGLRLEINHWLARRVSKLKGSLRRDPSASSSSFLFRRLLFSTVLCLAFRWKQGCERQVGPAGSKISAETNRDQLPIPFLSSSFPLPSRSDSLRPIHLYNSSMNLSKVNRSLPLPPPNSSRTDPPTSLPFRSATSQPSSPPSTSNPPSSHQPFSHESYAFPS